MRLAVTSLACSDGRTPTQLEMLEEPDTVRDEIWTFPGEALIQMWVAAKTEVALLV